TATLTPTATLTATATPTPTATATATPQGWRLITAGADTYIYRNFPTLNFRNDSQLLLAAPDASHVLLRFDLADLPPGAVVQQALLRIQVISPPPAAQIEAYQLLRPWEITAATWQRATWQEMWDAPGAASPLDRSPSPAGAAFLPTAAGEMTLDITPLAQAWAHGAANHGLLLRLRHESFQNLSLASLDTLAVDQRPRLELFLADGG
ncbi:MAG: DNRLRE domain-containing protein, partial [Caldilineales bacterium]|nr:DNRLRE domain-containing protein [Caldilineales bacterium]